MKSYLLLSLALFANNSFSEETSKQVRSWDFDHEVTFNQTKINEQSYLLKIERQHDTSFSSASTFLFRKASLLCNKDNFKLEVISGIEAFTDTTINQNRVLPPLVVEVGCNT